MLIVGLTGNIGSGKTVVAGIFGALGVPVYYADERAKSFLFQANTRHELISAFGGTILGHDGEIDRKALASLVFNDLKALTELNKIIHPRVMHDFKAWSAGFQKPYLLQEAAIIIESGYAGDFNSLILVSCPQDVAIERVMKRDGLDHDSVMQRMKFQMPEKEKAGYAEFVIVNDGRQPVIPQVMDIHKTLMTRGKAVHYKGT